MTIALAREHFGKAGEGAAGCRAEVWGVAWHAKPGSHCQATTPSVGWPHE